MIDRLDWWVLERAQGTTEWLQKLTGRTCFFWAKILCIVYAVAEVPGKLGFVHVMSVLSAIIVMPFVTWMVERETGTMFNKLNYTPYFNRIRIALTLWSGLGAAACLLVFEPRVEDTSFLIRQLTYPLWLYAISCTPLPPGTSWMKKVFKKAVLAVEGRLPAPDPVGC